MPIKKIYFLIILFFACSNLHAQSIVFKPSIYIGAGGGGEIFTSNKKTLKENNSNSLNLISEENKAGSFYFLPLVNFVSGIRVDGFLESNNIWLNNLKIGLKGFVDLGLGLSASGYQSNILRFISLYTTGHIGFYDVFLYGGLGFEHINKSESIIPNKESPIIYQLEGIVFIGGIFYDFTEHDGVNFSYRYRLFSNEEINNFRLMINYEYRF